jgi:hypothetical protein
MSCSDEHLDHGHEHHDHEHDTPLSSGPNDYLYGQIDVPHVIALNAQGGGEAGKNVIKWVYNQHPYIYPSYIHMKERIR